MFGSTKPTHSPEHRFRPYSKESFPDKPLNPWRSHRYTEFADLRTGLFVAGSKQSLEVVIMKSLIQTVVVAAALAAPVAVFAQANQPVTRAQVRAELIQLEKAGYNPAQAEDPNYPADIQAAEAKMAANHAATGVGGVASGSSDAGHPIVSKADWDAMYNHP
jgi:hypothetical protein